MHSKNNGAKIFFFPKNSVSFNGFLHRLQTRARELAKKKIGVKSLQQPLAHSLSLSLCIYTYRHGPHKQTQEYRRKLCFSSAKCEKNAKWKISSMHFPDFCSSLLRPFFFFVNFIFILVAVCGTHTHIHTNRVAARTRGHTLQFGNSFSLFFFPFRFVSFPSEMRDASSL